MAGIYTPTNTYYPNGVYTISSTTGTPYFQIQNSMGGYAYGIVSIYMEADTYNQLVVGLGFRRYNVNGNIRRFVNTTTIDPYQYQKAIKFKTLIEKVVLDGRTNINFALLPSENVTFVFYVTEIANGMFLPATRFFNNDFFKSQFEFNGFKDKL